ncbi:MAG: hypothetical protein IJF02_02700 [Oscillospiraceae bacterium]|nr:hypothetical protein [Oscillospiraceae bacterium]
MARQPEIQYINAYVSGTMAYQLEAPARRKKQVKLPKMRRQKKTVIALDPVAIGGIVVAAAMLVLLLVGFVRLQDARAEVTQLQNYVSSLQQENATLQDTYTSGYDLNEIEKIALAMGLVPSSEVTQISVSVTVPHAEPEPTAWESFCAFLTGLFA